MNPSPVHSIYHDCDGDILCFDENEKQIPYPANWPRRIADVATFCRERGITYRK